MWIEVIDKKIIGEIFLIIGGFILADTIVKKFLELSNNTIPWWVLPLMALLIIISGVNLKEDKEHWRSFLSLLFISTSVILLVLSLNEIISILWFVWFGLIFGIAMLLINLPYWTNQNK